MNIEKLTHSKCPNCKKYGIGALRGVSRVSTFPVICKYCGKKYILNSALSLILKIVIVLFWGVIGFIINNYFNIINEIPVMIILTLFAIITFCVVIRFCPMEEEKDKG